MGLLDDAVKKLEKTIRGSGCDDGIAVLKHDPDAQSCQYITGVSIECQFGGRSAHITTAYPIQAKTRVSFMFGSSLDTPEKRAAACAILNAVGSFLCISRQSNACIADNYGSCYSKLLNELNGHSIYLAGTMPFLERELAHISAGHPEDADIILVSGDGIFSDVGYAIVQEYFGKKDMLFLGPETSGLSALLELRHWCPFGR